MSGLGVRKCLIMAYKITISVACEWKSAGEPFIGVVSSLSLKASSPEKMGKEQTHQSSPLQLWKMQEVQIPSCLVPWEQSVPYISKHPVSWRTAKDTQLFII